MKPVVFFDWGGVIADDAGDDFFFKLLQDMGASHEQAVTILRAHMNDLMCGRISDDDFWRIVGITYGIDVPHDIISKQAQWPGLVPNDDILDYVASLHHAGIRTAVLSNVIRSSYDTFCSKGYYNDFDLVIASCEVGVAKPAKKIFDIALSKATAAASDCIFIDDKKRNIEVASSMGFKVVLAQNAKQIIADTNEILQASV